MMFRKADHAALYATRTSSDRDVEGDGEPGERRRTLAPSPGCESSALAGCGNQAHRPRRLNTCPIETKSSREALLAMASPQSSRYLRTNSSAISSPPPMDHP